MEPMTTGKHQVHSVKCCVVYDPVDGTIYHVHQVVTLTGAEETPDDRMEERALALASERGIDTSRLKVLHIAPEQLKPYTFHSIDPQTLSLVYDKAV